LSVGKKNVVSPFTPAAGAGAKPPVELKSTRRLIETPGATRHEYDPNRTP
jgi:hypothetical protein